MKQLSSFFGYLGVGLLALGAVLALIPGVPGALPGTALAVGGLALIGFTGMNARRIASGLGWRTAAGANAALLVFIFLGIMILVNVLSARHHRRFDVTANRRNSLSPQTLRILNGLDRDVAFAAFYREGEGQAIADLLQEYGYHSQRITFELIDPDRHPGRATQYRVNEYGMTVAVCEDRQERFSGSTEEDVTNAILKVTREGRKRVLFLKGHGEKDPFSDERDGYATARKAIEDDNYEAGELLLMQEGAVPGDCSALIIAGPRKELLPHEEKALAEYTGRGGKILFLLDPAPAASLEHFLKGWGVIVGHDVIVDVSGVGQLFGADEFMPIVTSFGQTDITRDFALAAFFPYARSVTGDTPGEAPVHVEMLAETSPQSWAETGSIEEDIRFDEGQDAPGPVSVAVVITFAGRSQSEPSDSIPDDAAPGRKTRLVVCGDSDFACNAYFGLSGNGDLFLNMVSWLAEEEDLIAIRPKVSDTRPLVMSLGQARSVFWFAVVTVPAMVVIAGLSVWWRRRR